MRRSSGLSADSSSDDSDGECVQNSNVKDSDDEDVEEEEDENDDQLSRDEVLYEGGYAGGDKKEDDDIKPDDIATPRPLFKDASAEAARRAEASRFRSGLGREMKAVGHEHDITCTSEIEPYWMPPEGMTLKDVIAADKAHCTDHRHYKRRLVYDYRIGKGKGYSVKTREHPNHSEEVHKFDSPPLNFESRFESGNLMNATQVSDSDYDLELQWDVNTRGNTQWFYFSVEKAQPGVPYTFRVSNLTKPDSLFNQGMRPLSFSMHDYGKPEGGWKRCGYNICYYANGIKKGKHGEFYSAVFTIEFEHAADTVYLAYCYPYTYTKLQAYLLSLEDDPNRSRNMRRKLLCRSLAGNNIDLITVTDPAPNPSMLLSRPIIILSSRVHPGETVASFMFKGVIDFLTGDSEEARMLRSMFIFKLLPMLNPDGVINGNYRANLAGKDLNRQYLKPHQLVEPPVFYMKKLFQRCCATQAGVELYCDFHGHSRKKNIFVYGCDPRQGSYGRRSSLARRNGVNGQRHNQFIPSEEKLFPALLDKFSDMFSYPHCSFKISKSKKATGRVVVWKEYCVNRSYTLEASFLGSDAGHHYNVKHLEQMGHQFCHGLLAHRQMIDQMLGIKRSALGVPSTAARVCRPLSSSDISNNVGGAKKASGALFQGSASHSGGALFDDSSGLDPGGGGPSEYAIMNSVGLEEGCGIVAADVAAELPGGGTFSLESLLTGIHEQDEKENDSASESGGSCDAPSADELSEPEMDVWSLNPPAGSSRNNSSCSAMGDEQTFGEAVTKGKPSSVMRGLLKQKKKAEKKAEKSQAKKGKSAKGGKADKSKGVSDSGEHSGKGKRRQFVDGESAALMSDSKAPAARSVSCGNLSEADDDTSCHKRSASALALERKLRGGAKTDDPEPRSVSRLKSQSPVGNSAVGRKEYTGGLLKQALSRKKKSTTLVSKMRLHEGRQKREKFEVPAGATVTVAFGQRVVNFSNNSIDEYTRSASVAATRDSTRDYMSSPVNNTREYMSSPVQRSVHEVAQTIHRSAVPVLLRTPSSYRGPLESRQQPRSWEDNESTPARMPSPVCGLSSPSGRSSRQDGLSLEAPSPREVATSGQPMSPSAGSSMDCRGLNRMAAAQRPLSSPIDGQCQLSGDLDDDAGLESSSMYDMSADRPRGACSEEDSRALNASQGQSAIGQWIHEWVSRQARHKLQGAATAKEPAREKIAPNYILEPPAEPLSPAESTRATTRRTRNNSTDFLLPPASPSSGGKRASPAPTIVTRVSQAERSEATESSPLMELYLQDSAGGGNHREKVEEVQLRLQQRLASIYTDPVSLLSYVSHSEPGKLTGAAGNSKSPSPKSCSSNHSADRKSSSALSVDRLSQRRSGEHSSLSGGESPIGSPSPQESSLSASPWMLPEINSPACRQSGSPSPAAGRIGSESPSRSLNERSTTKALSSSLLTTLTQDFPMDVARTGRRGMFPRRHGYLNF